MNNKKVILSVTQLERRWFSNYSERKKEQNCQINQGIPWHQGT